jgi:hypothetical protein
VTHTGRSWRPAVGRKFHRDGSARSFPGSSLVSALEPASSQVRLLQQVQRACRAERFGDRFTYLPTDSFHVTAFDLICDQVREAPHWSARLPLDTPLAETDRAIQGWLRDVEPWPDRLAMRFDRLGPVQTTLHAQLEPADPATADALASFRDRVAEATGVRHPTHDHYRFHVSLAYLLVDLEPEEQRAWERFRARIDADLQRRFDGLTLPSPRLVFFDTMCAFPERRGG